MENKKYMLICDNGVIQFFEKLDDAISEAESDWCHMSRHDKKRTKEFYVGADPIFDDDGMFTGEYRETVIDFKAEYWIKDEFVGNWMDYDQTEAIDALEIIRLARGWDVKDIRELMEQVEEERKPLPMGAAIVGKDERMERRYFC